MSLKNPVKYPVKYYSWQDTQAPQLANADGVIKTILKACLVTGYGSKQGAGWTSLFEGDYRIVLRRPLRTGNPPDIKIENGTITGTTIRHRIVAQDNPISLDDATELSAVNLLARQLDGYVTGEWHCIVSDFAFLLFYGMGANSGHTNILYVGEVQKLQEASNAYHVLIHPNNVDNAGKLAQYLYYFHDAYKPTNLLTKAGYGTPQVLSLGFGEKAINNDYFAQPILYGSAFKVPMLTSMGSNEMAMSDFATRQIAIANRPMLRVVQQVDSTYQTRALYIPLDYWEL